jgi:hypothetical protein
MGISTLHATSPKLGFSDLLNSRWHETGLRLLMAVVIVHWAEHIVQAYQVFVLHLPRPMAMGLFGMYYPWLMKTELLHYGFAIVMLVGLWILRRGFTGVAYTWWMASFWLQFYHHLEHGLLFYQALTHRYLFGRDVPTSIGQIWIPRVELHLIYNTLVFIPMVIAMYYHLYPPAGETSGPACTCARRRPHRIVSP